MIIINYYNYTPGTGCEPKDVKEPPVFPPSPTALWVPELKLSNQEKLQLTNGEKLNDKHMNGTALVLSKQFPDLPALQNTLLVQNLAKLQPALEKSVFFHYYCAHWALSHLKQDVVYLYDSLLPKEIHPTLKNQLIALYGKRKMIVPQVQIQKGSDDCGCFAIAFCVSLLFGDDPATLSYDQTKMRDHITECLSTVHFTPFIGRKKRSKRVPTPVEHTL